MVDFKLVELLCEVIVVNLTSLELAKNNEDLFLNFDKFRIQTILSAHHETSGGNGSFCIVLQNIILEERDLGTLFSIFYYQKVLAIIRMQIVW